MLISYVFLIGAIIHNGVKYVIMQKRFAFHLWYFYFIALFITILRAIIFVWILIFVMNTKEDQDKKNLAQLPNAVFIIDSLAMYGAIILGVQWLHSMQELSAMIRLSDLIQKYDGTNIDYIEKQKEELLKKRKLAINVTIALSIFLIVIPVLINFEFERKVRTNKNTRSYIVFYFTTMGILGIFSVLICWRLSVILKNIRRAFGNDFTKETLWLRITLICFVLAYVTRLIVQILMYVDVWPDIYYDIDLSTFRALLYVSQFLIYNHLPIGMILLLHHKNFRKQYQNEKKTIKRISKSEFKDNASHETFVNFHRFSSEQESICSPLKSHSHDSINRGSSINKSKEYEPSSKILLTESYRKT